MNLYCANEIVIFCSYQHLIRSWQRGVSGSKNAGCNAVIVSGLGHEKYSFDDYNTLKYCATTKEGANSLWTSYKKGILIRVFRSSNYKSIYRAKYHAKGKRSVYRYDGLYKIYNATQVCYISEHQNPPIFSFEMSKI